MKSLLTLVSILLLSGCVSYYYPQTALENGVYYAQDDPSYVIESSGYDYVSYYPWSSMDSFYLGYYPYRAYGYGYSGGFSFGLSYAYYSPWYAWHAPYYHHPHHYAWRPYYGHGRHRYGYGNNRNYRNDNDYRYSGNYNGGNERRNRRGEYADDDNSPAGRPGNRSYSSGKQAPPVKRYVSTTPSGHSDTRGMEIRSRGSKNSDKIKTQPIDNGLLTAVKMEPSSSPVKQTTYRSKRSTGSTGEVRYSAGAKQGRSRTQPVKSTPNSSRNAVATVSAKPVTSAGKTGKNGHSLTANSAGKSKSVKRSTHAGNRVSSGRKSSSQTRSSNQARSSTVSSASHRSSGNSSQSAHKKDRK
jgi:hypothetical protein